MRKLFYLLFFVLVNSCLSQDFGVVDPISPINISFKNNFNEIQICHQEIETKAMAIVKLKISKKLKIISVNLIDLRYKTVDNKIHVVKKQDSLISFLNNERFVERINIDLVNKKFKNFPYSTIISFPVYLIDCDD